MRISKEAAELARKKEEAAAEKKKPKLAPVGQGKVVSNTMFGESLFGAKPGAEARGGMFGGNPFSSGTASSSPFATSASELASKVPQKVEEVTKTFASALNISEEPVSGPPSHSEPWPQDSDLPKPHPKFYLADADYEILDKEDELPNQKVEMLEMDTEDSNLGASGTGGKEEKVFESEIDNTFQRFADRLSQNPEQVIRYEWKGSPLLYTKNDAVGKALDDKKSEGKVHTKKSGSGIPRCQNCGSTRCFEVQMTPHAITELESEEMTMEGMEWGTIIVGVCENDCQARGVEMGSVGYLEEWVGVQWEDVVAPGKR